jgi:integron integrase
MNIHYHDDTPIPLNQKPVKFLDRYRAWLRLNGYAYQTEKHYIMWVARFIRFHGMKHPETLGPEQISAFLSEKALQEHWSPSTQKTALNALANLYSKFLGVDIGTLTFQYASPKQKLPVVMSHQEAVTVIQKMEGDNQLMAKLMYGCGLRVSECIRLRVKDIDFGLRHIIVRGGKGDKDRLTLLPTSIVPAIQQKIAVVEKLHDADLLNGFGSVYMPYALAKKYPTESKKVHWQFLFPSHTLSIDPRSGVEQRHHVHARTIQRAVKRAAYEAKIHKPITSHCFRHSFATKLAMDGVHLTQVQKLLGHSNLETTEIYLHLAEQMGLKVSSPIDF